MCTYLLTVEYIWGQTGRKAQICIYCPSLSPLFLQTPAPANLSCPVLHFTHGHTHQHSSPFIPSSDQHRSHRTSEFLEDAGLFITLQCFHRMQPLPRLPFQPSLTTSVASVYSAVCVSTQILSPLESTPETSLSPASALRFPQRAFPHILV